MLLRIEWPRGWPVALDEGTQFMGQVKVEDLEVFARFRVAILKFAQAADQSLSNADSQIARTHAWLETEQSSYWNGQLRKRTEEVSKAREAVRKKKLYLDPSGRTPSAAQEEKHLAYCLAAVEHAKDKIEAIRKSLPRLEKAADVYRSGVSRLSKDLAIDVPQAVALLDRLAASLAEYIELSGPEGSAGGGAGGVGGSVSRGDGGEAGAAAAVAEPIVVAAGAESAEAVGAPGAAPGAVENQTRTPEDRHGVVGQ